MLGNKDSKEFDLADQQKNCGWRSNLFRSSLAIKTHLCGTAAKVSRDEAFIPQLFISMKFENFSI